MEKIDLRQAQADVDAHLAALPVALQLGEVEIMHWLLGYIEHGEWSRIDRQAVTVAQQLLAAGYTANAEINLPQRRYRKQSVFGRYIIGQILVDLQVGLPPPTGAALRLIQEYLEHFDSPETDDR